MAASKMLALHKVIVVGFPGALESRVSFNRSRSIHRTSHRKPFEANMLKPCVPEDAIGVVKSLAVVLSAFIMNAAALKFAHELVKITPEDESIIQAKHYGFQAPSFH